MSQPKALDSESLFQSLCYHGNGNRLEPHLVAISVSPCEGRKKEIYEWGWGERNIFCNAKQKESGVELHLKVAENLNSTVTMQIQDNGLSFTPFELVLYNSLYTVLFVAYYVWSRSPEE